MKLFVDDIRNAPDDSWAVARTVTEAIRFISQFGQSLEVISLDHDISHQVSVGELSRPYPCTETFAAVAYFMGVYYSPKRNPTGTIIPKIIIRTANPVGAETLEYVLGLYGLDSEIKMVGAANRLEMEV